MRGWNFNIFHYYDPAVERRLENIEHALDNLRREIMSVISDFAATQDSYNARQGAAIDKLVTSVDGVSSDVAALNALILQLQDSTGTVTAGDQALIDQMVTASDAVTSRLEGVAAALEALDSMTPPAVPPA